MIWHVTCKNKPQSIFRSSCLEKVKQNESFNYSHMDTIACRLSTDALGLVLQWLDNASEINNLVVGTGCKRLGEMFKRVDNWRPDHCLLIDDNCIATTLLREFVVKLDIDWLNGSRIVRLDLYDFCKVLPATIHGVIPLLSSLVTHKQRSVFCMPALKTLRINNMWLKAFSSTITKMADSFVLSSNDDVLFQHYDDTLNYCYRLSDMFPVIESIEMSLMHTTDQVEQWLDFQAANWLRTTCSSTLIKLSFIISSVPTWSSLFFYLLSHPIKSVLFHQLVTLECHLDRNFTKIYDKAHNELLNDSEARFQFKAFDIVNNLLLNRPIVSSSSPPVLRKMTITSMLPFYFGWLQCALMASNQTPGQEENNTFHLCLTNHYNGNVAALQRVMTSYAPPFTIHLQLAEMTSYWNEILSNDDVPLLYLNELTVAFVTFQMFSFTSLKEMSKRLQTRRINLIAAGGKDTCCSIELLSLLARVTPLFATEQEPLTLTVSNTPLSNDYYHAGHYDGGYDTPESLSMTLLDGTVLSNLRVVNLSVVLISAISTYNAISQALPNLNDFSCGGIIFTPHDLITMTKVMLTGFRLRMTRNGLIQCFIQYCNHYKRKESQQSQRTIDLLLNVLTNNATLSIGYRTYALGGGVELIPESIRPNVVAIDKRIFHDSMTKWETQMLLASSLE